MSQLFLRLEAEHRTLVDALDLLARYLDRATRGEADPHDVPRFAVFFRDFVELHHDREERILIPALARHDFSVKHGPLPHVLEEHAQENGLLTHLFTLAFQRGGCRPDDPALREAATALIAFERAHMEKETRLLYPAAKQALVNDTRRLDAEVARFDGEREVFGRTAWAENLHGELSASYPP